MCEKDIVISTSNLHHQLHIGKSCYTTIKQNSILHNEWPLQVQEGHLDTILNKLQGIT